MTKGVTVLRKIQPQLCMILLLFSIYALTTSGHYTASMDISAFHVAQSVFEDGDFSLTEEEVKTPEMRKGKDGNYYCFESLGSVLIPVPLLAISSLLGMTSGVPLWLMLLLTNSILTALSALMIYVIGRELKYSKKTSLLLSLIYGLGTMAWAHTRFLMPDPLASLVYLVTFLFLLRYKKTRRTRELLLTGVSLGAALHTRPDAFIFILAVGVGIFLLLRQEWRESDRSFSVTARKVLVFLFPVLIGLCLWGYYNYYRFGSILETGYTMDVGEGTVSEGESLGVFAYFQRFLNIGETIKGFLGMWVIPNRSIFFVNPILIFWLFALKPFWRKYRFEMTVCGIAFVLYVLLYSNRGAYGFPGSSAWGQRYFLPMIGFMTLSMGLFVEKMFGSPRRNVKILFLSILLLSICFQFIGASQNYQLIQQTLERRVGSEKARLMLTMDPRHSLLIEYLNMFRDGHTDLFYFNAVRGYYTFIRQSDIPPWTNGVWPVMILIMVPSGYLLIKRLLPLPAEAKLQKKEPGGKRPKRRRSKKR